MRVARKGVGNGATRGKLSGFNNGMLVGLAAVNGQENMPIPVKSTKLLITNLDNEITDSDVCELFSEFGSVREAAVHYNCWGYSLGSAHVVYLQPEDAAEAARRYNGVPLDGRPMTITLEGSTSVATPLPVKMRLSFGPNHMANAVRNPLSQLNRGGKTPKRLAGGPKPFNLKNNGALSGLGVARGRGKPRGRPAMVRGRPVGRLPTAAELDLELDEYLSQTKKNTNGDGMVNGSNEVSADDFGEVNEVLQETTNDEVMEITKTPKNTPGRSGKTKKTPSRTPGKTSRTPGKTPSRTPGKTPKRTPGKTPKRTPGKTPSRTPGKTPSRTPGKTSTPGKTPSTTPGKTPSTTPGKTPSTTPGKTPSTTPGKTPSRIPEKTTLATSENTPVRATVRTPARATARTPARTPGRVPAKTPGKTPGKSTKQTTAPNTTTDETEDMEVTGDLEKTNPPSAVPKSVKKVHTRRSGRFSKME